MQLIHCGILTTFSVFTALSLSKKLHKLIVWIWHLIAENNSTKNCETLFDLFVRFYFSRIHTHSCFPFEKFHHIAFAYQRVYGKINRTNMKILAQRPVIEKVSEQKKKQFRFWMVLNSRQWPWTQTKTKFLHSIGVVWLCVYAFGCACVSASCASKLPSLGAL